MYVHVSRVELRLSIISEPLATRTLPVSVQSHVKFPLSMLLCELVLSLHQFCLGNHIVEISWVHFPLPWDTISSSKQPAPLPRLPLGLKIGFVLPLYQLEVGSPQPLISLRSVSSCCKGSSFVRAQRYPDLWVEGYIWMEYSQELYRFRGTDSSDLWPPQPWVAGCLACFLLWEWRKTK